MNNVLNYYYKLYPSNIHQNNKLFYFEINSIKYTFTPTHLDPKKLQEIYQLSNTLIQYQIPVHQIIPNNNNELITVANNIPYILLKQYETSKEEITLLDILKFQRLSYFLIDQNEHNNWKSLWESKIDYFEYQINQFGIKYPIIRKSASYYIGLSEMAISLLNFSQATSSNVPIVLSHQRINNKTTYSELFNSLNFVIDSRMRDIAEYFKTKFFDNFYIMDEIDDFLKSNISNEEYILFFARMLFPSYYFDCFEEIITQQKEEKEILFIIEKNKDFEELLVDLYFTIQQYTQLPEIDWLKFYNKY